MCTYLSGRSVKIADLFIQQWILWDGPLENLWGAGEVQKKYSRKGKLNEKKFMHAN